MSATNSRSSGRDIRRADFFVTYTGADAKRAEWIAEVLKDDGRYTVVFQAWDFRPGEKYANEQLRRLLALDGGGIQGVIPPEILAEIERQT